MMRRQLALALALTSVVFCSPALGVLVAYDAFAYPAGALGGQSGGTGWGGDWTTTGTSNSVTSGGLSFGALSTTGNKTTTIGNNNNGNFRALTGAQGAPGTTSWISFLTNLSSGSSFTNTYNGISLFQSSTEQLFMGQTFESDVYGVERGGFGGRRNSTTAVDATTRFLVYRIDFGTANDTINMYVDPTPGMAIPDVAPAVANFSVSHFGFDNVRIQGGNEVNELLNFDELRIGDAYADVSPVSSVPEASSVLLVSAVAIGLLVVTIYGSKAPCRRSPEG